MGEMREVEAKECIASEAQTELATYLQLEQERVQMSVEDNNSLRQALAQAHKDCSELVSQVEAYRVRGAAHQRWARWALERGGEQLSKEELHYDSAQHCEVEAKLPS